MSAGGVAALALLLPGASAPPGPEEHLAVRLRELYAGPSRPGERWRRRGLVRLPDGREVARDEAWRDDPLFVPAARRLIASRAGDDAALGAWLLGTAADAQGEAASRALVEALGHRDPRVVFEAAQALGRTGGPEALPALERTARRSPPDDVATAAGWASREIRLRAPGGSGPPGPAPPAPRLAPGFRRGVSWWMSEGRSDAGAASFRRLASLGVTWVSLHTWDPLQAGLDDPVLARPDRHFGFRDLGALVRNAHAAGLRVMVKPHLEMRGFEARAQHNRIAMRSEADWRRWFEGYAGYILAYAREARAAGADLFCVGRELDATVIRREADWRALVARVRAEFPGPLTYSANFDTWQDIAFWDALDFIGVSAYFPLAPGADPSPAELEAGWDRALSPLGAASRRWGRPVLLTEAGFPSIPTAAAAPWREERLVADVWLQARCYEATLRALARRPFVEGAFFWLWERTASPPFRDPSHAIVGKPASFTLARWYAG